MRRRPDFFAPAPVPAPRKSPGGCIDLSLERFLQGRRIRSFGLRSVVRADYSRIRSNGEKVMISIDSSAAASGVPADLPRVLVHLIYDDVASAVHWLTRVFGFTERESLRHTTAEGLVGRTQLQVADSVITLGPPSVHGDSPRRGVSSMLCIYVDNVDEYYQHAKAEGAVIVADVATHPWGDRTYQVSDPEGHQWTFAQHIYDADPAECGE